jgi:DeoR family glycerol-3-phosphate regulon repressor
MMSNARKKWLVADHSKFGRNALVKMGHIAEFDALFSDERPAEPYAKMLQDAPVQLCVPPVS